MFERQCVLMVASFVLACGPRVSGYDTSLGDDDDGDTSGDEQGHASGEDGPTSETGDELAPPTSDLAVEPDTCTLLELEYETLRSELRTCEDSFDCRFHVEGDRCGCRYATNRDPDVEEVLLPLAAELDALGCAADCAESCPPANAARCIDGLCEAVVAHF
jgi:hypothetical protein